MTSRTNAQGTRRVIPLHIKILAGAISGAVLGGAAYLMLADVASPWREEQTLLADILTYVSGPIGTIFLRLLFMLIAPLMFAALVLGVSELGDVRKLGRIGLRTLAYTICVSVIAVAIGIVCVNVLKPGARIEPDTRDRLVEAGKTLPTYATATRAPDTGIDLIINIIPANPIKAVAEGDYLAWMFFSLMVGIGLCLVGTDAAKTFGFGVQGLYDVTMRLIHMVIAMAPIGVCALMFSLTARLGYEVLGALAAYVGTVLLGLAIHQFIVYSLAVRILGGMSPLEFFRGAQEAMVTAFSTASSNATLPTALRVAEEELRVPPQVSRFVLTIGATANQNGTALFEGVTVLFLAQLYGIELSFSQQGLIVFMCVLASIGTAGVPGGSLPVIALMLSKVGVPVEGLGLILGVDRFLDMCRTTLNVTGDLAAAVVVGRGERSASGRVTGV